MLDHKTHTTPTDTCIIDKFHGRFARSCCNLLGPVYNAFITHDHTTSAITLLSRARAHADEPSSRAYSKVATMHLTKKSATLSCKTPMELFYDTCVVDAVCGQAFIHWLLISICATSHAQHSKFCCDATSQEMK